MTIEEIRSVVETAVREGSQFPWWGYVLACSLSLAGGYVGAYATQRSSSRSRSAMADVHLDRRAAAAIAMRQINYERAVTRCTPQRQCGEESK
jgi:hypothetical protein